MLAFYTYLPTSDKSLIQSTLQNIETSSEVTKRFLVLKLFIKTLGEAILHTGTALAKLTFIAAQLPLYPFNKAPVLFRVTLGDTTDHAARAAKLIAASILVPLPALISPTFAVRSYKRLELTGNSPPDSSTIPLSRRCQQLYQGIVTSRFFKPSLVVAGIVTSLVVLGVVYTHGLPLAIVFNLTKTPIQEIHSFSNITCPVNQTNLLNPINGTVPDPAISMGLASLMSFGLTAATLVACIGAVVYCSRKKETLGTSTHKLPVSRKGPNIAEEEDANDQKPEEVNTQNWNSELTVEELLKVKLESEEAARQLGLAIAAQEQVPVPPLLLPTSVDWTPSDWTKPLFLPKRGRGSERLQKKVKRTEAVKTLQLAIRAHLAQQKFPSYPLPGRFRKTEDNGPVPEFIMRVGIMRVGKEWGCFEAETYQAGLLACCFHTTESEKELRELRYNCRVENDKRNYEKSPWAKVAPFNTGDYMDMDYMPYHRLENNLTRLDNALPGKQKAKRAKIYWSTHIEETLLPHFFNNADAAVADLVFAIASGEKCLHQKFQAVEMDFTKQLHFIGVGKETIMTNLNKEVGELSQDRLGENILTELDAQIKETNPLMIDAHRYTLRHNLITNLSAMKEAGKKVRLSTTQQERTQTIEKLCTPQ